MKEHTREEQEAIAEAAERQMRRWLHWIEQTDEGRRELVSRYFHHDVADPKLYDLVVNAEKFGPEGVANLIVEAFGGCSGKRKEVEP